MERERETGEALLETSPARSSATYGETVEQLLVEPGGWVAQDDCACVVRLLVAEPDGDPQALAPREVDQLEHILFATGVAMLASAGVQKEALKVAEAIED